MEAKQFAGFIFGERSKFGVYKVRKVGEQDRERLRQWIANDPDHRDLVSSDFFLGVTRDNHGNPIPEPGAECMVLEDSAGERFYFRISRVLRVDIQFNCAMKKDEVERNREALEEGFAWLLYKARRAGFRQMIFDSTAKFLMRFCERKFGFRKSPNELVCPISAPVADAAGKNAALTVQQ